MPFSHHPDNCFMWFGRTAEEILLALTCYDDCLMMKKQEQHMGGGWYCDKHKVRFENQNYCELCKLDDMRCPYCKCPGGSHYGECVVFSINRQEQKPMTREEAEIKVGQWTGLINALEALGLLKFDEAPKKQVEWVNGIGSRCWFTEGYDPNKEGQFKDWRKAKPMHKFRDVKGMIYFIHDEYLGS